MSPRKVGSLTEDQITELWSLFGPPPVLSTENQQAYDKLRAGYAACYKPSNILHVGDRSEKPWTTNGRFPALSVTIPWQSSAISAKRLIIRRSNCASRTNRTNSARTASPSREQNTVTELATLQAQIEKTKSDIEGDFKAPGS